MVPRCKRRQHRALHAAQISLHFVFFVVFSVDRVLDFVKCDVTVACSNPPKKYIERRRLLLVSLSQSIRPPLIWKNAYGTRPLKRRVNPSYINSFPSLSLSRLRVQIYITPSASMRRHRVGPMVCMSQLNTVSLVHHTVTTNSWKSSPASVFAEEAKNWQSTEKSHKKKGNQFQRCDSRRL